MNDAAAARADSPMLEARALHLWRGDRHLLRGVSFAVAAGGLLQVTGPNGVGKTSLLRAACGLLPVETGEVHWQGRPADRHRDEFFAQLAYLGHMNALKADLTALENLMFNVGVRRQVDRAACLAALTDLDVDGCAGLQVRALSAGQRRRVALARVLLSGAQLWVLDEPITNLDMGGIATVEQIMLRHLQGGGAIVTAAHQMLLCGNERARSLALH